jgi:transcriptional regulator GlxA family with amidase domain
LSSTPLSIARIAEEIGFSSAANFATAFRERLGITPSTYREELCCRDLTGTQEPALDTE